MAEIQFLVTGGAGFIGSNFIRYVLKKNMRFNIVNLDKLTYAGNLLNLKSVENNANYNFVKGDISNRKIVCGLFHKYDFFKLGFRKYSIVSEHNHKDFFILITK